MFKKDEQRFQVKEAQGLSGGTMQIIVDTATGVNYLLTRGPGISGITPLLDENGNVVIDS